MKTDLFHRQEKGHNGALNLAAERTLSFLTDLYKKIPV